MSPGPNYLIFVGSLIALLLVFAAAIMLLAKWVQVDTSIEPPTANEFYRDGRYFIRYDGLWWYVCEDDADHPRGYRILVALAKSKSAADFLDELRDQERMEQARGER